jgi:serine protease AprX
MKKNTVKGFMLLALGLGTGLTAFAQTPQERAEIVKGYDHQKLQELSQEFTKKAEAERTEAYRLAEINGWPITITEKDGTYKELKKVMNGKPAYFTTYNRGAARTAKVDRINSNGVDGLNLNGQGMIIGVWDGGKVLGTHQDLVGRVTQKDNASGVDDHATHVSGTMIGSGAGDSFAKGLAYQANLWANNWTDDLSEMTAQSREGLLISNHSYGIGAEALNTWEFGAYNQESRAWDNLLFQTEYYLPVVAAGNDRNHDPVFNPSKGGRDLLSESAVSKNVVTVAAIEEVNYNSNNPRIIMSTFSSWGPTDDGRVKPDISTKGVDVYSTWGDGGYSQISGTSMASPGISASLLLLQQHYKNLHSSLPNPYMRAATLRAVMAHTAVDADSTPGPDYKFGWGVMDAEAGAAVITNNGASTFIEETVLEQGATYTKTFTSNGSPLKVTIAWTDPAGDVVNEGTIDMATPSLVNDLDLRVSVNGVETLPWKLNLFNITNGAQRADNRVDNIEKIEVPETPVFGQDIVVTVRHKGTSLRNNRQKFSIVASGIGERAAIDTNEALSGVSVWPNPASDVLNISVANDLGGDMNVTVYDVQGRSVMHKSGLNNSENKIDISNLNAGVYFVDIEQNGLRMNKKLIKK